MANVEGTLTKMTQATVCCATALKAFVIMALLRFHNDNTSYSTQWRLSPSAEMLAS